MKMEEIAQLIECFDRSKAVKLQIKTSEAEVLLESAGAQTMLPVQQIMNPGAELTNNVASKDITAVTASVQNTDTKKPVVAKKTVEEIVGTPVKAPLVGTFYCAPSPEEKPFVEVGQSVRQGDVVGIIEAMKLMNEITAPADGVVKSIHAENGNMVQDPI